MKNIAQRIENKLPILPENAKLICELHGYEKCKGYAIDNSGSVWTCKEHNMKGFYYKDYWRKIVIKNNRLGYPFFIMSNFGTDVTARVHRVVALAFVPNNATGSEVNHKDGNKLNSHFSNLEWITHRQNIVHCINNNLRDTAKGTRIKNSILNDDKVRQIRLLASNGCMHKDISKMFSIEISGVSRIANRKIWKHVI